MADLRVTPDEQIDYRKVVLTQLDRVLRSIDAQNEETAMRDIDALVVLTAYAWDDEFVREMNRARRQFEADMSRFAPNDDLRTWAVHKYNVERLKILVKLLQRRGIIEYHTQAMGLLIPERVKELLLAEKRCKKSKQKEQDSK